jgi:hypothetical protein
MYRKLRENQQAAFDPSIVSLNRDRVCLCRILYHLCQGASVRGNRIDFREHGLASLRTASSMWDTLLRAKNSFLITSGSRFYCKLATRVPLDRF